MNLATLQVRVFNASYQELSPTTLANAIKLVEVQGRAEVIEADDETLVISAKGVPFLIPKVIRMLEMLKVPFIYDDEYFSKHGVLKRDKHKCGYCGKTATTHDHIQPKSKGGQDTWENSISACLKCNQKKADRTPEEANMPILYGPQTEKDWVPKRIYFKSDKPRRPRKKHK
jgi:hypothetical protein